MHSSHIQYCSFGDPYRPQKLLYKFETFKDDKRILVRQYLKVSCLFVILDRLYESQMLRHWMCELCMFSQIQSYIHCIFLNQARAGLRRAPGFLKLFLCGCLYACVCLCVCPPPRLLITSGVMWRDMDLI